MLGRLRGGTAGAIGFVVAVLGVGYATMHVGCTDYVELAPPIDATPVLDEAEAPALPTNEAGGEPARPDSATTLPPPRDAAPPRDASDASDSG